MLKRVDVAVYNAFKTAKDGNWKAGIQISASRKTASASPWTTTTRPLITPEMPAAVEKAKADIIAGTIEVHDYMSDNKCPY